MVLLAALVVLVPGPGAPSLLRPGPANAAAGPVRTLAGSLGPAPTDDYVQHLHQIFLGRTATASELADLAHVVHAEGPAALSSRLALSPEWAGVRIDELYRGILGRAPEPGGQAYWLDQLAQGDTLESVAAGFYGSDEYYRQVGGRPGDFVDSLYRRLLERDPDDDGRQQWTDRLGQGVTRHQVADAFYASVESRRQRVDATYAEILGRGPDPTGRAFWVARLPALGDVALASHLAASDELHRRVARVPLADVRVEAVGPGTDFPLTSSWRAGCPVGPADLRAVTFPHFRADGSRSRGVLIVHRDVVSDVAVLVRAAYGTRFPLTQARPVDDFGGDDDASMAADNSSAFNCRWVSGTTTWSRHAYGHAVDLNPVANPWVRGDQIEPPSGAEYVDRSDVRPGMLVEGGGVVDAADRIGWGWGGRWRSSSDYQHLSSDGR